MKNAFKAGILLLLILSSCFSGRDKSVSSVDNGLIINSQSLGKIKIGMPVDEFLKLTHENLSVEEEYITLEGESYDIYNVYEDENIIYAVEPQQNKVWRIWIYGNDIKTEKGIGTGDTLGDIRKLYNIKYPSTGEGQLAIIVEDYEYSFLLNTSDIPESWWKDQKPETLNDNLKIKTIIIR